MISPAVPSAVRVGIKRESAICAWNTRITRILVGSLVLAASSIQAAEFHVAPDGNDTNPGTKARPFATIQAAVNKLQPGDTCLIRAGVYRETVTFPRSGTADKPITLKPYGNERVTVSGCEPVTGWTQHAHNIWKAPMPWTLGLGRNQVFAGGQVMIEARHPNVAAPGLAMYVADLSPLWPTYGEFSIPRETRTNQPGRIVSRLLENQPDDYWKGALYCGVHFEGWCAQTGVIESSKSGEINVGDRTTGWWFGSAYGGKYPQEHEEGRGMIVGHLNALDVPTEWHWQDNVLYLVAPDGGQPQAVEAKRRQLAFDLSGRENIRIEGLAVRAASMRLENAAHCTVDRCDFAYISHYTRHYGIGQIEHGRDTIKSGETGIYVSGRDNAFVNCSVRFSAGAGFHLRGYHHSIHNCLIDEVSYVGHYLNAITDAVSDFKDYEHMLVGGHAITFNTMRNAGRHFFNFYGNGPSLASRDRGPMDYAATLFAGNHLYNGMLLTRDAGFITSFFSSGGTLNGVHSQVAYNVMHDCYDIAAMRWNHLGMIYLDNGSREVDVHHNLLWAAPGSLQHGIWFNPPNINVSDHANVFHGLFTRTSNELRAEDFPRGEPFRFGHDFAHSPLLPQWPQLDTLAFGVGHGTALPEGVVKSAAGLSGLKDGDGFYLGTVDFAQGWQSAVLRLASTEKSMNTHRAVRDATRHQKATDPLVLDTHALEGSENATKNWQVHRVASGGWLRFNQVPLGAGYHRFRAVYGTAERGLRRIEVRLDQPNGPLAGQVLLPPTDRPRGRSIQIFGEGVGELSEAATGTRDVYFVGFSEDGKPVAEFEYFRFERARAPIELPKNDVRMELRVGSREGEKIGEFFPRFTGGADEFRDFVARLEPARGVQPLFLVVRSSLPGPIGTIGGVSLQKAKGTLDWSVIGVPKPPLRSQLDADKMILPEPTHRPCASPSEHYRKATGARPIFGVSRLASRPVVDGLLSEWTGRAVQLKQTLEGADVGEGPTTAWVGCDDQALYVAMSNPFSDAAALRTAGHLWGETDGVELALQDPEVAPSGTTFILRGWADGHFGVPDLAGASAAVRKRLEESVTYRTRVGKAAWTCEWRIPFAALGGVPALLNANLTVRNPGQDRWRTWRIASGSTYDLHNGATLVFGARDMTLPSKLRESLEVWLDASDVSLIEQDATGAVGVWKDKSGKGRHAVQGAAGSQPRFSTGALNGKPALQFDDSRRTRMELPDLSDRPMTATVFAVVSNPGRGALQNQHQRVFTTSNGKDHDYICGINCFIPSTETAGPRVIMAEAKERWAKSVRVGCFSPTFQTFFNGQIAEILVFGRTLTKEEQIRVTAYLTGKWGL